MKIEKDLTTYADIVTAKYPELCKELVLEILTNAPARNTEYELAYLVQKQLGLSDSYFSKAYTRNIDIKAHIIKDGSFLFVKLDKEIKDLLSAGYICCKIFDKHDKNYDYTIQFTKNIVLGFYK